VTWDEVAAHLTIIVKKPVTAGQAEQVILNDLARRDQEQQLRGAGSMLDHYLVMVAFVEGLISA